MPEGRTDRSLYGGSVAHTRRETMAPQRVFLGWEGPCLHRAVRFLWQTYAGSGFWDLSRVILAVPGGRAGRRLSELLAQAAASGGPDAGGEGPVALTLPRIVTAGALPEELYLAEGVVADDTLSLLALAAALRELGPERLAPLVGSPPTSDSLLEWAGLARELGRLRSELAGEGMRVADAARRCGEVAGFPDAARWGVLCAVEDAYREVLAREGLVDRHEARLRALDGDVLGSSRPVILLATVDLNRVTREMLGRVTAGVTALIPAPSEAAGGFDELGCLVPEYWGERDVPIPEEALRIVDRPADQATALLDALADLHGERTPEEITVGVGDESMAPALERALRLSGVPVRSILGRSLGATRPALLLSALCDYLSGRRAEHLAALLRHPDLESYLRRHAGGGNSRVWQYPSLLDDYAARHLPGRLDPGALGDDFPAALVGACRAIEGLCGGLYGGPRPLLEWAPGIVAVLQGVYGHLPLDPDLPENRQLLRALRDIAAALEGQSRIRPESPLAPSVSFAEAIRFTLRQLSGEMLPLESDVPAVELLGWLELALDDAPALIVTGVNEGSIPASVRVDPFLPDGLRRALGLVDNRRRYARDVLLMTVILHSRPQVTLIAGRRGVSGDPLTPSRLLFACDEETLVRRARALVGGEEMPGSARALLPAGSESRFWAPRPVRPAEPIRRLRVTDFAAYLSCPYRFYLARVLRLSDAAEEVEEMDALLFGSLIHEVLEAFAAGEARDSTDPGVIAAFLEGELDARVRERFGSDPSPAVRLQQGQALRRLQAFAAWHARHAAEGWRIRHDLAEKELQAELDVDGEPFTVTGRIDRVDEHAGDGRLLLLDYKSGDRARRPEETHGVTAAGDGEWVDLQLPLYRLLAQGSGIAGGEMALGYVNVPSDLPEELLAPAPWTDAQLDSAEEKAREVIRAVRDGAFWPPGPVSKYGDAFSGLCFDTCPNRAGLLANEPPAPAAEGEQR